MPKKITQFEIKRSEWARGYMGPFLRYSGKTCAIGAYCRACGVPDKVLKETATVAGLRAVSGKMRKFMERKMTSWAWSPKKFNNPRTQDILGAIYSANDRTVYMDSEREHLITSAFRELGITVTFVD